MKDFQTFVGIHRKKGATTVVANLSVKGGAVDWVWVVS